MTIRSTYVIVCVLRCKEIQDREKRGAGGPGGGQDIFLSICVIVRCKEIQDREKRGRVDQGAAKRMITSGLWKPGDEKIRERGNALSRPPLTFYALDDFPVLWSRTPV